MTEQEIRAKALEIAVLIRGSDVPGRLSGNGDVIISHYLVIAEAAEKYIRGDLKLSSAESLKNP